MKKSLLWLIVLVMSISIIVSFTLAVEEVVAEEKVELTLLNYLDIAAPEAAVWDNIVEAFNAKYPNIKLTIENSVGEAYHQKLASLAGAGDLPDVMFLWSGGRSAEIYKNELVEDLYPFLGTDKDKFLPTAVEPQWDGKLYELPSSMRISHVIFVNTKLLDDLGLSMPSTYDELVAMVKPITEAGLQPIIMSNKEAWVMQSCLFSTFVGRICGDDWICKASAGEASFTDQEFIDSIALVEDMYNNGLLSSESIQLGYGDSMSLFITGKAPFMIDGDWRIVTLILMTTEEEQENFDFMVFPDIAGQKGTSGSASGQPGSGFGMKKGLSEEKADAAWKWIYFFAGPEVAEMRFLGQGIIPTYKMDLSVYEDVPPINLKRADFYTKTPTVRIIDDVIYGEPILTLNNGLQELGLGNTTPEKLAADLEAAMELFR